MATLETALAPLDDPHRYELTARATDTDDKAWVAVVTGTHPDYGYDRDFVAYQDPDDDRPAEGSREVRNGEILEVVREPAGGQRETRWYHVDGGELVELREEEADVMLRKR